jgi:hypothetical protein
MQQAPRSGTLLIRVDHAQGHQQGLHLHQLQRQLLFLSQSFLQ